MKTAQWLTNDEGTREECCPECGRPWGWQAGAPAVVEKRHGTLISPWILLMVGVGAVSLIGALLVVRCSVPVLALLALLPLLAVVTHAFAGFARLIVYRLVFSREVRQVRGQMAVDEQAGTTSNLGTLRTPAPTNLQAVHSKRNVQLVETALRKLNHPAALSHCELASHIPRLLLAGSPNAAGDLTDLERAPILRAVLADGIERLRPSETGADSKSPRPASDLFSTILHDAYLKGMPNRQIMLRHGISEGTFYRYRREAIQVLAHELMDSEDRLRMVPLTTNRTRDSFWQLSRGFWRNQLARVGPTGALPSA